MFHVLNDNPVEAALSVPLVSGYQSGIRRGALTKGQRLTQQVTSMIDLIVSDRNNEEAERDFKIGELIGLVQWVEANSIIPDDTKSPA